MEELALLENTLLPIDLLVKVWEARQVCDAGDEVAALVLVVEVLLQCKKRNIQLGGIS